VNPRAWVDLIFAALVVLILVCVLAVVIGLVPRG
jgi:hypothetical protein